MTFNVTGEKSGTIYKQDIEILEVIEDKSSEFALEREKIELIDGLIT